FILIPLRSHHLTSRILMHGYLLLSAYTMQRLLPRCLLTLLMGFNLNSNFLFPVAKHYVAPIYLSLM
ncbi:MAG: hypothetical protein ACU836_15770, partial [Gammaproteobacteria bacterium]